MLPISIVALVQGTIFLFFAGESHLFAIPTIFFWGFGTLLLVLWVSFHNDYITVGEQGVSMVASRKKMEVQFSEIDSCIVFGRAIRFTLKNDSRKYNVLFIANRVEVTKFINKKLG